MTQQELMSLLQKVQSGQVDIKTAAASIQGFEDLHYAKVDHTRADRQGFPEVIYGAGKTTQQVLDIARALIDKGAENILCTRIGEQTQQALAEAEMPTEIHPEAKLAIIQPIQKALTGLVLVMCAGTSDLPVSEEAALTAKVMGAQVERIYDVGVAGIHRLLAHQERINKANAIICVAGMEGALPSVVAGLTARPLIAVPTSVGYGASFGGLAALLAMLNTCASGVSVVNIDNGFGAGYQAALINRIAR